jgi:hypothetical protein
MVVEFCVQSIYHARKWISTEDVEPMIEEKVTKTFWQITVDSSLWQSSGLLEGILRASKDSLSTAGEGKKVTALSPGKRGTLKTFLA